MRADYEDLLEEEANSQVIEVDSDDRDFVNDDSEESEEESEEEEEEEEDTEDEDTEDDGGPDPASEDETYEPPVRRKRKNNSAPPKASKRQKTAEVVPLQPPASIQQPPASVQQPSVSVQQPPVPMEQSQPSASVQQPPVVVPQSQPQSREWGSQPTCFAEWYPQPPPPQPPIQYNKPLTVRPGDVTGKDSTWPDPVHWGGVNPPWVKPHQIGGYNSWGDETREIKCAADAYALGQITTQEYRDIKAAAMWPEREEMDCHYPYGVIPHIHGPPVIKDQKNKGVAGKHSTVVPSTTVVEAAEAAVALFQNAAALPPPRSQAQTIEETAPQTGSRTVGSTISQSSSHVAERSEAAQSEEPLSSQEPVRPSSSAMASTSNQVAAPSLTRPPKELTLRPQQGGERQVSLSALTSFFDQLKDKVVTETPAGNIEISLPNDDQVLEDNISRIIIPREHYPGI